jgi:hypothetical protein
LWEYSHEQLNTGVTEIDAIETALSGDRNFVKILTEAGDSLVFEDGSKVVNESYRIEDTDPQANNEFFGQSTSIDFIDFSEVNPFSEGNSW